MSMDYVRKTYGVPAKRGMRVEIYSGVYRLRGQCLFRGKITSASNYIHVNGLPFHPTQGVVYYDDEGNVIKDTREWKKQTARCAAGSAGGGEMKEQPAPTRNDTTPIVDLVKGDLEERRRKGIETYGMPLRAWNGRDALVDAYEEALDLCCYLRQAIQERNGDGWWSK